MAAQRVKKGEYVIGVAMSNQNMIEEYVMRLDGIEQCPECGHIWNDQYEGHYHDCRYFILENQEDGSSNEDDMETRHQWFYHVDTAN